MKSCAPSSFRDHADILAYNKCRLAICTPVAEHDNFFTARRYASAVYAVVVCPSVTSRYCIETTGRVELVFGTDASFHLSHTVLNLGISKIRVHSSGTLFQSLENFARQVDRIVNKIRRRSSLLTTPIRQSTSRGCLLQVGHL